MTPSLGRSRTTRLRARGSAGLGAAVVVIGAVEMGAGEIGPEADRVQVGPATGARETKGAERGATSRARRRGAGSAGGATGRQNQFPYRR